jgi:hypothetical protein
VGAATAELEDQPSPAGQGLPTLAHLLDRVIFDPLTEERFAFEFVFGLSRTGRLATVMPAQSACLRLHFMD